MAKDIVQRELERSVDKCKQPSFYECIYEAYMQGVEDASNIPADTIKKAQSWHYIELEGNPTNEERCWCLCQYDGYRECEKGYYNTSKQRWVLNWEGSCFRGVIAWHKLPTEEDK